MVEAWPAHATWIATYDGAGNGDVWIGLAALDSSAVITFGTSIGANGGDVAVRRHAAAGAEVWTRRFDGAAHLHDRAYSGVMTALGNLVIAGNTAASSTQDDALLLCYEPDGDLAWQRTVAGNGGDDDVLEVVSAVGDGSVYAAGTARQIATNDDWLVCRVSAAGALLWSLTADVSGNGSADNALAVAAVPSGGVVVAGIIGDSLGRGALGVRRYSDVGAPVWSYDYPAPPNRAAWPRDIAIAPDGSVYVCGFQGDGAAGTDWVLIKLSSTGVQQWVQTWNGGAGRDQAVDIEMLADTVVVLGVAGESDSTYSLRVASYAPTGASKWSRSLGSDAPGRDEPRRMVIPGDGGIYVCGGFQMTDSTHSMAVMKLASSTGTLSSLWTVATGPPGQAVSTSLGVVPGALFTAGAAPTATGAPDALLVRLGTAGTVSVESTPGTPRTFRARVLSEIPARRVIDLEVQLASHGQLESALLDVAGRVVARNWLGFGLDAGTHRFSIPIEVRAGIYFIRVTGRSGGVPVWWHRKIVVLD